LDAFPQQKEITQQQTDCVWLGWAQPPKVNMYNKLNNIQPHIKQKFHRARVERISYVLTSPNRQQVNQLTLCLPEWRRPPILFLRSWQFFADRNISGKDVVDCQHRSWFNSCIHRTIFLNDTIFYQNSVVSNRRTKGWMPKFDSKQHILVTFLTCHWKSTCPRLYSIAMYQLKDLARTAQIYKHSLMRYCVWWETQRTNEV